MRSFIKHVLKISPKFLNKSFTENENAVFRFHCKLLLMTRINVRLASLENCDNYIIQKKQNNKMEASGK